MIITLVPREKNRKVACVLNGIEMLSPKATTNKTCLLPHYQKAVDNNLSEEKTEHLTCDRSNYSQPTSPLYDPPLPFMTHPTPPLHDPPHPSMTHPTPT